LTSSDYDLNTYDALIWIEFTKTTHGTIPTEVASTSGHFVVCPEDKKYPTIAVPETHLLFLRRIAVG
jgi:hypothetical protein